MPSRPIAARPRPPVVSALAAALVLLAACSKPGVDAPPPPPPGGDAPAASPPTSDVAATTTAAAATPTAPTPAEDRYDPVVTATDAGWLVGWTADGAGEPGERRVAVAFVAADAAPPEPLEATTTLATGAVAGLRLAGPQAVWVEGVGAERRLRARRLDSRGAADPARDASTLATGATLGSPEAVVTAAGVVVAWPDGEWFHAVRLDAAGAVAARATWRGGNARPESHFRPDDAPPNPNPERSAATGARPWILGAAAGAPPEVRWEADWWLSDDQGGRVTARHVVTWGETDGEGSESEPPGAVWAWLADLDPASPLAAVQEHDPNGGPWSLRLTGLGDAPVEITRGPAGPYTVDVTSVPGPAVAFHDPATSRYRVVRVAADGAQAEVGLPTTAPFGEAGVALAGAPGRTALAVAYTTLADGRLAVRLAVLPADARGDRDGPRLTRPDAAAVALPGRFSPSQLDAVYVDGRTLVTWQDHWDWHIRAAWLRDGALEGRPLDLSGEAPRAEGGASVALPDGGAAVAFQTCSGSSICGDTKLHVVKLVPGREPTPMRLGQRPNDRHPRLCVGPMGPVLAVQRGDYGSVSVTWGADGARHTVDVPTPNYNNGAYPQGLSCGAGGIFVVMSSFGRAHDTGRLDLVAITADGATTRETLEAPGSLWAFHALVDDGDRVGLVTNLATPTGSQVALRWYPTAGGAPTATVLQRKVAMWNPEVMAFGSGPERRFAAAWYDRASDAVFAVLTAPDGRRVAGPLRLDDPGARESQNAPIVVHEGDHWAAYWQERDQLYRALPF